jgi:hypothetical protein
VKKLEKLKSIKQFNEKKSIKKGYICITDNTRRNKVHQVLCRWITEKNFIKKIITNGEKQGSYFYSEYKDILMETYNGSSCRNCSSIK